jgi:hypothetical protein
MRNESCRPYSFILNRIECMRTEKNGVIMRSLNAQLSELQAKGKDFKELENNDKYPDDSFAVNCSDVFQEKSTEVMSVLKENGENEYIQLSDDRVVISARESSEWLNEETGELVMLKPSLIISHKRESIMVDAEFED